jgi:hypothetical protein
MEIAEKYIRKLVREFWRRIKTQEPLKGGVDMNITKRLKKDLMVVDNKVYSYDSHVADIEPVTKTLFVKPEFVNYSATTNGHLKDVAYYFDLKMFGDPFVNPQRKLSGSRGYY